MTITASPLPQTQTLARASVFIAHGRSAILTRDHLCARVHGGRWGRSGRTGSGGCRSCGDARGGGLTGLGWFCKNEVYSLFKSWYLVNIFRVLKRNYKKIRGSHRFGKLKQVDEFDLKIGFFGLIIS